jgi:hypothetical protein
MPTVLDAAHMTLAVDPREDRDDGVFEAFDRMAFAQRALDLVQPRKMRVAVCGKSSRLRVEVGRDWGEPEGARWALVAIPDTASRRSIALAIAELADCETQPYVLDVLLEASPAS